MNWALYEVRSTQNTSIYNIYINTITVLITISQGAINIVTWIFQELVGRAFFPNSSRKRQIPNRKIDQHQSHETEKKNLHAGMYPSNFMGRDRSNNFGILGAN